MKKPKNPSAFFDPAFQKQPRAALDPAQPANDFPAWRFAVMDVSDAGRWSWKKLDANTLLLIQEKLKHFESMRWSDIERGGSHNIEVEDIHKDAFGQLVEFKLDDTEEVFSLRLSGKQRVWGIRDRNLLRLLWWDPLHEICLSRKKHT